MKIEFNVIPQSYCLGATCAVKAWCARFLPLALIVLCAAEFLAFSFYRVPRLRERLAVATSRLNASTARTEQLAQRCEELDGELQLWKKMLENGVRSVPALEFSSKLNRALPASAELQSFSVEGEILQLGVLFADPQSPDLFLRKMALPPYGVLRPLERRTAAGGALYLRFEARRK
ncbi:MAG: hypothetical protein ACOYD9_04035 [Pyramidobacter sp.]|jgi:hypothetical protein